MKKKNLSHIRVPCISVVSALTQRTFAINQTLSPRPVKSFTTVTVNATLIFGIECPHTAHMHRHQPRSPQVTNSVILVPQCLQKRMGNPRAERPAVQHVARKPPLPSHFGTNNARISACARSNSTQVGSMSPVRPFPIFNGKHSYSNMTCQPKTSDREGLCQTRA